MISYFWVSVLLVSSKLKPVITICISVLFDAIWVWVSGFLGFVLK